ncbi:ProQ/FINO family protein [Candidatus Finniella inopinata]|uniref:ProQ/FinO domain-containing protein n=1 Tax=Candidatus Finniella inopinata TaxID=1696036 RepID=A0A4Q7DJF1_9PROT|nr:ProQ/FINO family protein [Candidatus Finniella inopinata]RZI46369.1 hypothetical protein EQU50_01915 [Candidatus Finniella inopinata]
MSSNKQPRTSLSTETWEKLRSLKGALSSSPTEDQELPRSPDSRKDEPKVINKSEEQKSALPQDLKKTWIDRRKEHEMVIAWLSSTFPEAFNFKNPKPLKVSITKDIYDHLPDDGTISKVKLRSALKYYTHSTYYLKALAESEDRVDLSGASVEPIDASHKEFTQKILTQRTERKKDFVKKRKPFKGGVKKEINSPK